ncbi:cytochrome c [Rhizobium sp. AN80A]|uniref:c-type cytochrome n=1 Tax=Rhizobium sp. AN80A TaxID=3040673 RepID=UPI0024B33BED|nr:cytochrome c [Rhizobium sp. AN80A]
MTEGLSRLNDADVRAIAVYINTTIHSGTTPSSTVTPPAIAGLPDARTNLFDGACGGCHEPSAPMGRQGRPLLSETSDMNAKDPRNAVQAVLQGIRDPSSDAPFMPSFADNLTDRQIADLLAYGRSRFTTQPPWPPLEDTVRDIRKENAQ